MTEILKSMIEIKICDCMYEMGRLAHDYSSITDEDKLAIELRKEYLKGKVSALEQVMELMNVSV